MSLLHTLGAFLVAIVILVSLHELGHLLVARWCGIKVLRFSVGFGKPLLRKRWHNIEWCLAPIPLGGYVKMVDTREGNVAEADLPYAFDKQHPAKRIAVVAAGPLTNLALAVALYAVTFHSFGVKEIRPVVGTVERGSLAAQAGFQSGDTITAVNGQAIATWGDAQAEIAINLDAGKIQVAVTQADGQTAERTINAADTPESALAAKRGGYFGLSPHKLTTTLSDIAPNSPAERAGLQKGDTITAVNGQPTPEWQDITAAVRAHPQDRLSLDYRRNSQAAQTFLRPDSREAPDGSRYGFAGFNGGTDATWLTANTYQYTPSFGEAVQLGAQRVYSYGVLTMKLFARLFTGQASLSHISGPITIADYAGKTANAGLPAYLEFLAVISVSLGILNLLPIPVLDGGHLMYYAAEWIRGKPVSERMQMLGIRIGLSLMLMLMLVAFFNDISRLFG